MRSVVAAMRPPLEFRRFDDLRVGRAWSFPEIAFYLVAHRPQDVAPVLEELERATADGWWAFGFIAYEAASGLDSSLVAHEPMEGLPLAWFGVCARPDLIPAVGRHDGSGYEVTDWVCDWTPDVHRNRVESVRAHIAAGETYHCNLTTRVRGRVDGDLSRLGSSHTPSEVRTTRTSTWVDLYSPAPVLRCSSRSRATGFACDR